MTSDSFDSVAKQASRMANVACVRDAAQGLWTSDGVLRCRWAELLGQTGHRSLQLLLDQRSIQMDGFVGVDRSREIIDDYRAKWPGVRLICGDIFTNVAALLDHDVGVLNLDEYGEVGTVKAAANLSTLRPLITRAVRTYGQFVLIWNKCIDSTWRHGGRRPSVALREQVSTVLAALSGYAPRSRLRREDLLPADCDDRIDAGFIGNVGAFEIYKGKRNGWRMANMRLIL